MQRHFWEAVKNEEGELMESNEATDLTIVHVRIANDLNQTTCIAGHIRNVSQCVKV